MLFYFTPLLWVNVEENIWILIMHEFILSRDFFATHFCSTNNILGSEYLSNLVVFQFCIVFNFQFSNTFATVLVELYESPVNPPSHFLKMSIFITNFFVYFLILLNLRYHFTSPWIEFHIINFTYMINFIIAVYIFWVVAQVEHNC